MKKKRSKNCNVSRLRCQCNHRRCRHPLAASSFARSPRPPLLGSRRSITSFSCTQHSALGAGTQLDAEPAPPSHTPAETQSRTSLPPRRNLEFFPTTRWSGRSSSSHNTAGHDPRTLSSPPNWLPMSLHGACRRNNHVAPREARAHNTPHATPSTDKSCTSRTANIPHSTAPAPVGRHPSSTLSSPHHWLIHLSKARCVQSLPPRQCKARAHTIPHADAEKRSWHRRV